MFEPFCGLALKGSQIGIKHHPLASCQADALGSVVASLKLESSLRIAIYECVSVLTAINAGVTSY